MKMPKFLLTTIALLTLIAVVAVGALLGVFAVSPLWTFTICTTISVCGIYAGYEATLLIRFYVWSVQASKANKYD